jgi:hypothetical protein
MKAWLFAGVVAAGGAACTKPNPALSCEDGLCSDPLVPFCDVTGSIEGEPNTCIKPSCTPSAFEECRGDKALMCNSTGTDYDLLMCAAGCSADSRGCKPCETLECKKHIIPKYLPTECDALATNGALTISADTQLDTSDDTKCTRIVPQASGPEICVLHYETITIDRNTTYAVTGSRALALVSDQELLVDGVFDVGVHDGYSGPGGGLVSSGAYVANIKTGGGGAGFRTAGAPGGTTAIGAGANGGGATTQNPAVLSILIGGTKSGGTINNAGGAATLVSCRGVLTVKGIVDAGGGGGKPGYLDDVGLGAPIYRPATGGGSGGVVVFQGMQLAITGGFFANGGGGGAGGDGVNGTVGADGMRSIVAANGGVGTATGGTGGAGGAVSSAPQAGAGESMYGNGGAGGGSSGFFLAYSPGTAADNLTPSAISPAFEPRGSVATN